MPNRTIIVGDVHGCAHELERLLSELKIDASDSILLVGDLINKGPDSHRVIRMADELGARATLGNHERRLLLYRQTGDPAHIKFGDIETMATLTESDWDYLKRMPLTIELPEHNAVVVHGGFLPGISWREQGADIVTRIQVIDGKGRGVKRSKAPKAPPWADFWNGPEFVVYGHTPRREIFRHPHAIGLDTGCVHGGRLSAFILPEREIFQIRAARRYTKKGI